MFIIDTKDVELILSDYGIMQKIESIEELLRYHYEKHTPDSKEVRLIVKVNVDDGNAYVIMFKNEEETSADIAEEQCKISEILEQNGIHTPHMFKHNTRFTTEYHLHDYDVFVTVEEFVNGQIQVVDPTIANKTGRMLAKSHNIAENLKCHVDYPVLFDPFGENDIFFVKEFKQSAMKLSGEAKRLYEEIMMEYERRMTCLSSLRKQPKYAVQGDISCENLYLASDGQIGIFDYNRCGDNILYCDVIMQALYEARLMDYPESIPDDYEDTILWAFLSGYNDERSFSPEQKEMFPHLYAIITTFWGVPMYHKDGFINSCKNGDNEKILFNLRTMKQQISSTKDMIIS